MKLRRALVASVLALLVAIPLAAQMIAVSGGRGLSSPPGGGEGGLDLSWLPASGQWASVGTTTMASVRTIDNNNGNEFDGNFCCYMDIWAGGEWAPNYGSVLGSLVFGPNGGHASYNGNDVLAYDVYTRTMSVAKPTYVNTAAGVNGFGEYPDGSPMPPHGYDGESIIPIGTAGTLVVPQTYTSQSDANARTGVSHLLNLATGVWTRGATFTNPVHPAAASDRSRGGMWYYGEATGPLTRFDGSTITTYASNNYAINGYGTVATIDTRRDRFVHFDASYPGGGAVFVTDLNNPGTEPSPVTVGDGPWVGSSFDYVEEIDRIVAWNCGKTVYLLNPNNYAAGWSTEGSSSTLTPPATDNGCANESYGRYRAIPAIGSIVGVSDTDTVAWAYKLTGTTAPTTVAADWAQRIAGSGVVWYHDFSSDAEADNFRWSPGFSGGNDPNDVSYPGRMDRDTTVDVDGNGSLRMTRPTGTGDGAEWWRPFKPINSPGNGRASNDPAANGTITRINFTPTSGGSQTNSITNGFYGQTGGANFDGTEYYVQVRIRRDPNRDAGNNPSGGKIFYFTRTDLSLTTQEIVTMSQEADTGSRAFYMYRAGSPPLYSDSPGSGTHGHQPGNATGMVGDGRCRLDNNGGRLPNCWNWPSTAEWITLLYHVRPGSNGGGNTLVEVWEADWGETTYRKLWYQPGVNLSYSVQNGHNALIFSSYMNGANMGTAHSNYIDQLIFSTTWIRPPMVYDESP